MLVDMLEQHPEVACLGEILRYGALAPARYVENRLGVLDGRVRGFKLLSYQLRSLSAAGQSDLRAWLTGRGVRVIHLRRDNLFAHAVSNIYAARRGAYHSTDRGAAVHRVIHVEPAELRRRMDGSRALLAFEEAFLHGIERLELGYERDLEGPAARARAFAAVTGFLDLPPAAFEVGLTKVTPRDYRSLISNYDEIAAGLAGSADALFLPGGAGGGQPG